jgi:folylpolyglutamate synthase/dihydropteroate synthase
MKLQQILNNLQRLHPKEIDLSLDRIYKLCKKLGNPQDNLKYISVIGTNGKYSTIQAIRSLLKDANIKCNIFHLFQLQIYILNYLEDCQVFYRAYKFDLSLNLFL